MIIRPKAGLWKGVLCWVEDSHQYEATTQYNIVALEVKHTTIRDICYTNGRTCSGYVQIGTKDRITGKRIMESQCLADSIRYHKSQLSMLEKQTLGKPDKVTQKKILECIPI